MTKASLERMIATVSKGLRGHHKPDEVGYILFTVSEKPDDGEGNYSIEFTLICEPEEKDRLEKLAVEVLDTVATMKGRKVS